LLVVMLHLLWLPCREGIRFCGHREIRDFGQGDADIAGLRTTHFGFCDICQPLYSTIPNIDVCIADCEIHC